MSITEHPDERERLHRAISECRTTIASCPHTGRCRTCEKQREYIAEFEGAINALDSDETEDWKPDYMEMIPDGCEVLDDGRWELVPAGVRVMNPTKKYRVRRPPAKVLDIYLPYLDAKAAKFAATIDPQAREKLLSELMQLKTRFARDHTAIMETYANAEIQLSNLRGPATVRLHEVPGVRNAGRDGD